jgi:hypothetical protein
MPLTDVHPCLRYLKATEPRKSFNASKISFRDSSANAEKRSRNNPRLHKRRQAILKCFGSSDGDAAGVRCSASRVLISRQCGGARLVIQGLVRPEQPVDGALVHQGTARIANLQEAPSSAPCLRCRLQAQVSQGTSVSRSFHLLSLVVAKLWSHCEFPFHCEFFLQCTKNVAEDCQF